MPLLDGSMGSEFENRLIAKELNYSITLLVKEFKQLMITMIDERYAVKFHTHVKFSHQDACNCEESVITSHLRSIYCVWINKVDYINLDVTYHDRKVVAKLLASTWVS